MITYIEKNKFAICVENGESIPIDVKNYKYRALLAEVDAGEAEIIDYVESPADPRRGRDEALAALVHDFGDGRVIQCRPHPFSDENNMRNAIEQMNRLRQTERLWFAADNTAITVTPTDLQIAIESGQDQSAVVWADFFTAVGG